ncbi:unnamed protein product [Caenorhabditis auriculariae]|uniref:Secreted RxLR effector peptide protein n=1 Tax=Caenorhabditis auriculariae TaxID=2777116 RepID=A0A8S1GTP1_9PELO|nr:unnamed protein product [Caenorhabditis auriculariae]
MRFLWTLVAVGAVVVFAKDAPSRFLDQMTLAILRGDVETSPKAPGTKETEVFLNQTYTRITNQDLMKAKNSLKWLSTALTTGNPKNFDIAIRAASLLWDGHASLKKLYWILRVFFDPGFFNPYSSDDEKNPNSSADEGNDSTPSENDYFPLEDEELEKRRVELCFGKWGKRFEKRNKSLFSMICKKN